MRHDDNPSQSESSPHDCGDNSCQDCLTNRALQRALEELMIARDQIQILNSRIQLDAKSYERDQYLIAQLRQQLKEATTQYADLRKSFAESNDRQWDKGKL